jgi:hypothetical protein
VGGAERREGKTGSQESKPLRFREEGVGERVRTSGAAS